MTAPVRLFLFSSDEELDDALPPSAMSPAKYLATAPPWSPRLDDTVLWLEGAKDPLVISPLGRLNEIAPQLLEAAARLEAGQPALLRTASDSTGVFLALEPHGEEVVPALLAELPAPLSSYYPLERSFFYPPEPVDQRAALYAHLREHRADLVPRRVDGTPQDRIGAVRWPRAQTISALRAEAQAALALLERLAS